MIFVLQVALFVSRAILAIPLRFISGLLNKPNANTTSLTCYAQISCAVWSPSSIVHRSYLEQVKSINFDRMTQRAVGVHEWCEIRLIWAKGRLACARNQVGFGIRGGLFGYFLPK